MQEPTIPLRVLRRVRGLEDNIIVALAQQLDAQIKLDSVEKSQFKDRAAQLRGLRRYLPSITFDEKRMPIVGPHDDMWVDNDWPRDFHVSEAIMFATPVKSGFAVADLDGRIIKQFDRLEDAEKARSSARVSLSVDVDIEDEDADKPRARKVVASA